MSTIGPSARGARTHARPLRLLGAGLLAFAGALWLSTVYLLALALAAADALRRPPAGEPAPPPGDLALRLVVVIPAHDEQSGIGDTLASLELVDYPPHRRRTLVVADNCSDLTAEHARSLGAEVWERVDTQRRGKGHALAWAIARLLAEQEDELDAVVVLDADCVVSHNLLRAIDSSLRAGASVAQVSYEVANPSESRASALRFAAFALMDRVRPLGKHHLGLSCGLFGSGMAFERDLLRRIPWTATGLTEDGEYHMRLVAAGERVHFLEHAWVRSAMPTSLAASATQQARWEQGKLDMVRGWTPRLLASGLARRDPVRVHAALEQLVPPQSLLVAGSLASSLAGALLGSRALRRVATLTLAGQLVFVLSGLRLVRAPLRVYLALLGAPLLVATKLALYAQLLRRRGPSTWVRTTRPSSDTVAGTR